MVNPFPHKPLFLHVCSTSLLKTVCENEKFLVTSNFSFSHSVFYWFGNLSAIVIKFETVVCKTLSSLTSPKYCHLGKGSQHVHGKIDLPFAREQNLRPVQIENI